MSHFTMIAQGIDVEPLLLELEDHPQLWNARPERRAGNSPHRETSDIWVRYATEEAIADPEFAWKPHRSVWWPAADWLPAVSDIIDTVRRALGGWLNLGGILITRIPPGKEVYWHDDRGTWHAEHYTTKVWIVLRGNDRCVNHVEGESMVWHPGEAWSHDNLLRHRVENRGDTERIVLILCFRRA